MIETLWTNLSEAQGAVLNGLLTVIAAAGGVWFGARMFGGRVANLQSAIDASKTAVDAHVQNMNTALNFMKERTEGLVEVLAGMSSQVGRIESNQIEGEQAEEMLEEQDAPQQAQIEYSKGDISALWNRARDHLEEIASSLEIDGRTRAKYLRIDRRSFERFIDALAHDDYLTERAAEAAKRAFAMSKSFRRREALPTQGEIDQMRNLVDRVTEAPIPGT